MSEDAVDTGAPDRPLGFDDLVAAYFDEAVFRACAKDLADYHARRLRAMEDLFACAFDPQNLELGGSLPGGVREHVLLDRGNAAITARDCLRIAAKRISPFGVRLAGIPGPIECAIVEHHKARMEEAAANLHLRLRETFAECLRLLYPGIEDRTIRSSKLLERGVPAVGPDPGDYW